MPKICPLRMAAQESDWETLNNGGPVNLAISEGWATDEVNCIESRCAWWNDDFGACSLTALATAATRPVAIKEQLGHD